MNKNESPLKWLILLGLSIGVIAIGGFLLTPTMQTNGQALDVLNQRLQKIGVGSASVTLMRREPLQLNVILREEGTRASREELWRHHLVIREVELLYLAGYPVSAYKTTIERSNGEVIVGGTRYLYPDTPSQQVRPAGPPAIGDRETEEVVAKLVRDDLDRLPLPKGLRLVSVKSVTGVEVRENTKVLIIEIATPDQDIANEYLKELGSVGRAIAAKANATYGAQIAILRLQVLDDQGIVVGEYIRDYEIEQERWWFAEGMDAPWSTPPGPFDSPVATPVAPPFESPLSTPVTYEGEDG